MNTAKLVSCLCLGLLASRQLQAASPKTLPLTISNSITGSISLSGQQDRFTFTGSAGQRLFYDSLTVETPNINAYLLAPSGLTVWNAATYYDHGPFYLTENGQYTLVQDGNGDTVGNYAFRLLDFANALPVTYGTVVSGSLPTKQASVLYTFSGTNGQRVSLESIAATSSEAVWYLISPSDQTLLSGNLIYNLGEAVLVGTGNYMILVQGASVAAGPFSFQFRVSLISNPGGPTLGFGTVLSGTFTNTQVITNILTAPAGSWVYFDSQTNVSPAYVYLIDTNDTTDLSAYASADAGPVFLPRSGNYTLKIQGYDNGSYQFRLLETLADATPLVMGTTYQQTLSPGFKTDLYRFTGAAGQRVMFDSLQGTSGSAIYYTIYGPSGSPFYGGQYAMYDSGPLTLPEPGTYLLALQGNSVDSTSQYSFRLLDLAQAPVTPLVLGAPINGTLNPGLRDDVYSFYGTNGQRFYFAANPTNANASWYVYGRTDGYLSGAGISSSFEITLSQTGTNLLVIYGAGSDPVGYNIEVFSPPTVFANLVLGNTVSNYLSTPGEEHRYTFTGTPGQRLVYDALDVDADSIVAYFYDPQGNYIYIGGNAQSDYGPFTLNEAGTYTLLLKANGGTAGDYQFRLVDLSQPQVADLALNTPTSGVLNPGTQAGLYRLVTAAGQRLFFDFASTNLSGSWALFGPVNQYLAGNNLNGDSEIVTPQAGTNILYLTSLTTTPVLFSFQVITASTSNSNLIFGSEYNGSGVSDGTMLRLTFTGAVGQRLYYDALETDFDAANVILYGPRTNVLFISGNADSDSSLFTLPESGTYTLTIEAYSDAPATYHFRMLDLSNAPAIPYGTPVSDQIVPGSGVSLYRLNGIAGQKIQLSDVSTSSGSATWALYDLDNAYITSAGITASLGPLVLPKTGTYALIISPGPLTYQFLATLLSSGTGNTSGFGVTQSGTTTAGQTNSFSFTAPAGTPIFVDSLTNSSPANYQLVDPSGTQLFIQNASYDYGPYVLPASGTFTFNMIGAGAGSYSFRILDISASPSISFGTTYSKGLDAGWKAQFYRFQGTNGQRLYYDAVDYTPYSVTAHLIDPNGTTILSPFSEYDSGPFTLANSGTYYIWFDNQAAIPANSRFRILEPTTAPARTLSYNTTIGGNLFVVPAGWLSMTGSYVNVALASYSAVDDWRVTQTIAGTRTDAQINYAGTNWGSQASVGLNGGSDANWNNFSVQWDGTVTITNARTRLYTMSQNASRMWIDVDHSGTFEPSELVNNGWGNYQGLTLGPSSAALAPGTYPVRIQYYGASPPNTIYLMADTGVSVDGLAADLYQFNGTAGQRVFFQSLNPYASAGSWYVYGPNNESVASQNLVYDAEFTLGQTGSYLLFAVSSITSGVPYGFRLLAPPTTTNNLVLESIVSGNLSAIAQADYYTFNGTAGQRIYYDDLNPPATYNTLSVEVRAPSGAVVFTSPAGNYDMGPRTLTETGPYSLRVKGVGENNNLYSFRLFDVANAPLIALDAVISNTIAVPYGTDIYRLSAMANLRLLYNQLLVPSANAGYFSVFGPSDQQYFGSYVGNDFEQVPTEPGTNVITVANLVSSSTPYAFQVVPGNHPPVLLIPDQTVNEQSNLTFTVMATDSELPNDTLTFSMDPGAPSGATLDPVTGIFSWTPTEAQGPGVYSVTIRVRDDGTPSFQTAQTFSITVNEINLPPVLTVPGMQTLNESTTLNVSASATDPDIPTNTLTFSLASAPPGMTINPTTGAISWTPTEAQGPSTNVVAVVVTDFNPAAINAPHLSATNSFTVVVNEVNTAPLLPNIPPQTVNEQTTLIVTNTATDLDIPANTLTYVLLAAPAGTTIDTNGIITWTPNEAQGPSTNLIVTQVTDYNPAAVNAQHLSAINSFTVFVNEVNTPPILPNIPPQTVNEQTTLTVTNTATDLDIPANTLTYTLLAAPAGATIDTNGIITWTPGDAQSPSTNVFVTQVTDYNPAAVNDQHLSAVNVFTVVVNEANSPPVLAAIAGRTISAGVMLMITNTATDPDMASDQLTFSLASAPAGGSINPVTGVFQWRPSVAQANTTNRITVRVSDNETPPLFDSKQFTVTVNPLSPLRLTPLGFSDGRFSFRVDGTSGPDYTIQASITLTNWTTLRATNSPAMPFTFTDFDTPWIPLRFYRVLIGP